MLQNRPFRTGTVRSADLAKPVGRSDDCAQPPPKGFLGLGNCSSMRAASTEESPSPRLRMAAEPGRLDRDHFLERGYAGPVRVLSGQECRRFLQATVYGRPAPPLDWGKGHAAGSRAFYEIATHPEIIDVVAELLGRDIMLWGASIQTRRPGVAHPWHCDIESSSPSSQTVAVWIGLENTTRDSSLKIVPFSHHFGVTIQEMRHHAGKGREQAPIDDILGWARERDVRAEVLGLDMTDGEALFFDGRLWHGSHNVFGRTRHALLLQYAPPDDPIRIPDLNFLDWPFKELDVPRPPCLLLRGRDRAGVNRIVSAPVATTTTKDPSLKSHARPLKIPLPPPEPAAWRTHRILRGATADLETLSCHASALAHDQFPHAPHTHKEEELLLLLAGEVDLILPDDQDSPTPGRRRLTPGQFVYYPTGFPHTLKTVSKEPANYLMFKWYAASRGADSPLPFGHFHSFEETCDSVADDGFQTRRIFQGPTSYLRKLHGHASTLTPGAGYEAHVDAYDVAIIVLEGEVETLGERVGPHSVIFYRAGEAHGMRNPGDVTAKYLVFEFHGGQAEAGAALPKARPLLVKLGPAAWKRRLRSALPKKLRRRLKRLKERVSR